MASNNNIEISKTCFCFSVEKEELNGYTSAKVIYPHFSWMIKINKRKGINDEEVIDLHLVCSPNNVQFGTCSNSRGTGASEKIGWLVNVDATMSLRSVENELYQKTLFGKVFTDRQLSKTLLDFIRCSELGKYERNGQLVFDITLQVSPIRYVIEPIEQIRSTYRFIVDEIDKSFERDWKKYGPDIFVRGTKFKVAVGKEKENLQIFLNHKVDPRNRNWTWNVKCSFKLLSFDENIHPVVNAFNEDFNSQEPVGLGFPKFLTWTNFVDPSKKYIQNGKAVFEIDLEVQEPESSLSYKEPLNPTDLAFQCSICLRCVIGNEPTVTKCGHVFCSTCINRLTIQRKKCPLCNADVVLTDLRRIFN